MMYSPQGKWAVITGASAGIGAALAQELARLGCNLILVARRADVLSRLAEQLKSSHGIQVEVLACDLSLPESARKLTDALTQPISLVVNNAGFGNTGPFETQDPVRINQMLNLNVRFLTEFCQLMVPRLKAIAGPTRILNVGSIAGFQGVPYFNPYAATKAYVNNLSEGLNWELRDTLVRVTNLAPGSTASEFFKEAKMEGRFMSTWGVMDAETVAKAGISGMLRGKALVIPGFFNKVKVFGLRITPRWLVRESILRMFADLR